MHEFRIFDCIPTMKKWKAFWICLLLFSFYENIAKAGMPQPELSDIAKFRFETISFFLMGFLISSLIIQKLWNYLKNDFVFLPFLSYRKSLALTGLWGLAFLIVLTMISGARELMTPGAWEKKGNSSLYQLKDGNQEQAAEEDISQTNLLLQRRAHLEKLQGALWYFASRNEGKFPTSIKDSQFPKEFWNVPDNYELQYEYFPDLKPSENNKPVTLVKEPDLFDDEPLVLLNDGIIMHISRKKEEEKELQKNGEEK